MLFQVGMLKQFLVLLSLGKNSTKKRFEFREKGKGYKVIRLPIKQKRWNLSFLALVSVLQNSFPKNSLKADSGNFEHRQRYC